MKRLIALFALTLAAACGSDTTEPSTPTAAPISGVWTLRTINGAPLPFIVQDGGSKVTILNAKMTISDGGTWSETIGLTTSINNAPAVSQTSATAGTWIRVGQVVSLHNNSSGSNVSAVFDGTTLTTTEPGFARAYTR